MTALSWDDLSARVYHTGVDRGVLYRTDNSGVAWNGLTSVTESTGDMEIDNYYLDGVKYLAKRTLKDFSGVIKALTYPDDFMQFDGSVISDYGLIVPDQVVLGRFGLCYRTMKGNGSEDINYGYRLHILYNLLAKPDDSTYPTIGDAQNPIEFSWSISGVPVQLQGFRPSVHYVVDTNLSDSYRIAALESVLYGNDYAEPRLPTIDEIVDILGSAQPLSIDFDGGAPTTPAEFVLEGGAV